MEREESPDPAPIVGELRADSTVEGLGLEDDELLSRIVVTYEDEDGARLGTAPPPSGIARVDRGHDDAPANAQGVPTDERSGTKETKPTKETKGRKPAEADEGHDQGAPAVGEIVGPRARRRRVHYVLVDEKVSRRMASLLGTALSGRGVGEW